MIPHTQEVMYRTPIGQLIMHVECPCLEISADDI